MQKLKKVLKSLVKSNPKKREKKESPKKPHAAPKAQKAAGLKASVKLEKNSAKKLRSKTPKKDLPKNLSAKKPRGVQSSKVALPRPLKKPEVQKEVKKEIKKEKLVKADKKEQKPLTVEKPESSQLLKKNLKKAKSHEATLSPEKVAKPLAKEPKVIAVLKDKLVPEAKQDYSDAEVILTDAEGRRYCRVKECDQIANVDAYCRYHYLLFWKKIQVRKKILTEGKLERYVEELTARYPDKYLEMLRKDLRSEKDFLSAIQELELDDSSGENELEDEAQSYIEEVRGMSSEGGSSREDEDF